MTRFLPITAGALVVSFLIGALIADATGVGTLADALGNGTKLSAPSFMIVVDALAALAVARGRRGGAYVLLAITSLSLAAIAFDGDLGNDALSPGHVVWQVVEVLLTAATWTLALAAVTRRRSRPAAA
jgi:hypothetical protein